MMIINNETNLIQKLKQNEIGVIPTDTIFGLVTKITNTKGLLKIFHLKKRKIKKSLPILVGNLKQLSELINLNQDIEFFLKNLSTPTTIIYKKKENVLKTPTIWKQKTLAIRLVKWPWLQKILIETGPLVATSCNESSFPFATKWEEVLKWESRTDFIFCKNSQKNKSSELLDWETKKKLRVH